MAPALLKGKNYRVVTMIPGVQRVPREMVASYLGEGTNPYEPSRVFNLRPLAGTQDIPKAHILSINPTDQNKALPRKIGAS